jgi:hypothetical protein
MSTGLTLEMLFPEHAPLMKAYFKKYPDHGPGIPNIQALEEFRCCVTNCNNVKEDEVPWCIQHMVPREKKEIPMKDPLPTVVGSGKWGLRGKIEKKKATEKKPPLTGRARAAEELRLLKCVPDKEQNKDAEEVISFERTHGRYRRESRWKHRPAPNGEEVHNEVRTTQVNLQQLMDRIDEMEEQQLQYARVQNEDRKKVRDVVEMCTEKFSELDDRITEIETDVKLALSLIEELQIKSA